MEFGARPDVPEQPCEGISRFPGLAPTPTHLCPLRVIEATGAFAEAFREGQRGIVLMRTFNEAPDVEGPTVQHTITPGDDGMLAAAFLWRLRTGFTATGWRERGRYYIAAEPLQDFYNMARIDDVRASDPHELIKTATPKTQLPLPGLR